MERRPPGLRNNHRKSTVAFVNVRRACSPSASCINEKSCPEALFGAAVIYRAKFSADFLFQDAEFFAYLDESGDGAVQLLAVVAG